MILSRIELNELYSHVKQCIVGAHKIRGSTLCIDLLAQTA